MSVIIYNVTVKIEDSVQKEWLIWMKAKHIPDVMATACFNSYRLLKLIGHDDDDGSMYAIQYECPNEQLLEIYQKNHGPDLQKAHKEKFGGKYVAFRSLLEVLDQV